MKQDKKYHVLAGLIVAVFVGLPCYLESLNLFAGLWSALTSGIIAGGIKEYCDIGAVLVALLILGMHYGKG